MMERVKVSLTIAQRRRGSGVFHQAERTRKQRRAWDMWTEAAIETLRQLALEGKSASSIAAALGAPSRNAVIGKANRIGVKLTGNIHCLAPRAARPSTERPRRPAIARTDSPLWNRAVVPAVPRERKPAWAFAEAQVGEMLKVGLEEIREDSCRWPLGDPTSEEFVYCGVQTAKGRSYCAGH
jgi:GcrA cell cycle regulator